MNEFLKEMQKFLSGNYGAITGSMLGQYPGGSYQDTSNPCMNSLANL